MERSEDIARLIGPVMLIIGIGMIGGMSWKSTVTYYQIVNEVISKQLGGLHSAKSLLYSVDFAEIEKHQVSGEWEKGGEILAAAAENLEKAGADFIVICTNTMHKVADQIQERVRIPILHIADATAGELIAKKVQTTALLGTKYTMTQDFYKSRLLDKGLSVLIPDESDVETVNSIIYNELCRGLILDESKRKLLTIIGKLAAQGAEAVILGCTEIGLLVGQADTSVPLFDTTIIHATRAEMLAIGKS